MKDIELPMKIFIEQMEMIRIKNIYLIVGPSGVGKTTVVHELCKRYGLSEVISYTTRKRRNGEGNTHIFTNQKGFDTIRKELVAYTKYDGYEYGVPSTAIETNDLYVIDPAGIKFFEKAYQGNKQYKIIFITVDEDYRHMRMLERGDKSLDIARRLANDKQEFYGAEKLADYIITNYNLNKCVKDIWNYIQACERT